MVILEHFSSPAPWDALSFTLKNLSCTDQSQRTPGFLLGTVPFLLLLGGINWVGGSEWARVCSQTKGPAWTVLTSGAGISPMNRARALALMVNEPSTLNWCCERQSQSHGAFYSTCISFCCTELSSVDASLFSFPAPHPSQPSDTYVSCWNFFSQPPALKQPSSICVSPTSSHWAWEMH